MATKPDVPRETLEKVATSYHELMTLNDRRSAKAAEMIRVCVKAIVREPTPFEGVETRRKIVRERREAIDGLGKLAEMLDRKVS